MSVAKAGDTVHIHYVGTLGSGEEFDSSRGREPLRFELGAGQVIPGFDDAVTGMTIGDEKRVVIPADQAYGERNDQLMMRVDRSQLPDDVVPKIGDQLQVSQGENEFVVTIAAMDAEAVVLDANHPLAGQALTFDLRLVDIE